MDLKHFLFTVSNMMPETWEAIVFAGIPAALVVSLWFYVAFLKLRFYLRTRYPLDGLSGLAVLLMAASMVLAAIYPPLQELFPKAHLALLIDIAGASFVGGMILSIVLRPYTRFGRFQAVVQNETETMR